MKKAIISLIVISLAFNSFATDIVGANSPTKSVTNVYDEPIDQYMDVIDFNLLTTNVLFLEFDAPGSSNGSYEFGMGHKLLENLYLAGNLSLKNIGMAEETKDLVNASTTTKDSAGNPTGYTKTIDSYDYSIVNTEIEANVLGGLKLGALTLGIKAGFQLDEDADSDNDATTKAQEGKIGIGTIATFANDSVADLAFTQNVAGSENTDSVVTSGELGGSKSSTVATAIYDDEGYIKDSLLGFDLSGGTQLALGNFVLDLGLGFDYVQKDQSKLASVKDYKTYYDSNFADFGGVDNASEYNKTTGEEINVSNKLGVNLGSATSLPLGERFTLTPGINYGIAFELTPEKEYIYKTTGFTQSYDVEFIKTVTTTENYKKTIDGSNIEQLVSIPVELQSKFGNRFEFGVKNVLSFGFENTTETTSSSYTQVEKTRTNDPTDADDKDVTTNIKYFGFDKTEDTFTIENTISAGAKFFLTDKVRINLGSSYNFIPYSKTTTNGSNTGYRKETETTKDENGTYQTAVTTVDIKDVPNDGAGVPVNPTASESVSETNNNIEYRAGITYFFNQDMFLDLAMDATGGDIWNTANYSLLMTIRY